MKFAAVAVLLATSSVAAETLIGKFSSLLSASEVSDRHQAYVDLSGLEDNKGGLEVGSDTDIHVVAQENRSTGYSWAVTKNTCGSKLTVANDSYEAHPAQEGDKAWQARFGSAGKRTWIFQTPGEDSNHIRGLPCELEFQYKRPWEKDSNAGPEWTKTVTVTVN